MAHDDPEVLILGAGIAGCALAYHLARRGVGPIVVHDPRTPAAGASGRAAGIVTEQLWNEWDVRVTRESQREYGQLAQKWEPEAFRENGFVRWTRRTEVAEALDDAIDRWRSWGVPIEEASIPDLQRWIPTGRFEDVAAAVICRTDAVVTPSSITTIYAEGARQAGATFDFGQAARRLEKDGDRFVLELASGPIRARRLVVAAGAWSKAILARLGHPVPLVPYRTQAALLRPPTPIASDFPSAHDLDSDVYLRPESNGRILGGDGTEHVEADPERFVPGGDSLFLEHLAESLSDRFPGWADSEVLSAWAGVCSSTPDRRPLIGPIPGAAGLFVIAGFNGFGVMRAGGAARRLSDLLTEGESSDAARQGLEPVWPGRFRPPLPEFLPKPGFTLEPGDDPRF
ncbi:MAG: FAD-binding oxidoreductase [Thermoplasmata archaeon]|nr:FAD-binding oxidoreductase [Thermoplasmata archaeon]